MFLRVIVTSPKLMIAPQKSRTNPRLQDLRGPADIGETPRWRGSESAQTRRRLGGAKRTCMASRSAEPVPPDRWGLPGEGPLNATFRHLRIGVDSLPASVVDRAAGTPAGRPATQVMRHVRIPHLPRLPPPTEQFVPVLTR